MFVQNGKEICINVINKLAEIKDDCYPAELQGYIDKLPGVVGWFHDGIFGVECGKVLQLLADLKGGPTGNIRIFVVYRNNKGDLTSLEIRANNPHYSYFLDVLNELFLGEFGVYIRDAYEVMEAK